MLNGSVGNKARRTISRWLAKLIWAMWTWKILVRWLDRLDFVLSQRVEAGLARATCWKSHVAATAQCLTLAGRKTDIRRALTSAYGLLCASFGPKAHQAPGLAEPRMAAIDQDDRTETPRMEASETPLGSADPKGEQVAMPLPSGFSDIPRKVLILSPTMRVQRCGGGTPLAFCNVGEASLYRLWRVHATGEELHQCVFRVGYNGNAICGALLRALNSTPPLLRPLPDIGTLPGLGG
jgi:hypothetical protein